LCSPRKGNPPPASFDRLRTGLPSREGSFDTPYGLLRMLGWGQGAAEDEPVGLGREEVTACKRF
jgi:hypothetical protein